MPTALRGVLALTCAGLVAWALGARPADAQVLYGSIVGNVTDSTGASMPGATVTIEQTETKLKRELITDAAGAYHFTAVPTGTYTITVSMSGFRAFGRPGVPVSLNSVARVDAKLEVGQLTETVSVTSEAPILQTDRAEVRSELSAVELTNLPVPIGRNYQQLFKTLPGFTAPADAHSIPSNPSRALVFNVNGASDSSNNTRIDGVSTTNIWLPHVAAYVPALESLEAVNVVTNSFDAEQGLAGGSAINVQIKSGTNQLKGSAFEYYTNEAMREKNYFQPPGTPKGDWAYHQFGGTVGGPIQQNRLFYFGSYESTRDKQNATRTISVPTAALRRGDLSASANPIYDPLTGNANGTGRTPFAGNIIPRERIDATARKIIDLMPLPNLPGETNNYFAAAPFEFNRWTLDTKVNWNATSKLNIFGRYSHLDFWTFNEAVYGDVLQGVPIAGGNPGTGQGYTANFSAGATYIFTPSLVADAHFGYVRMYTDVAHSDIGQNKGMDMFGIPGLNGSRDFEGGMPVFDFDTFQDAGITELYMPYTRDDDQYQTVVNINWMKGQHNVRFGTDIYFQGLNHVQPELSGGDNFGARGGFRYRGGPTQISGGPSGNMYNAWASFLLGYPNQLGRLNLSVAPYTTRMRSYSFYVRDQWQMTQSPDDLVWHALRVLPRADARGPRARALQPGDEPDGNRRRRIGADGPWRLGREGALRAAHRRDVPGDSDDGDPRRVRHHQRPVLAGAADADESSDPAEPDGRGAEQLRVGRPDGGWRPADSRSGPRQRHHPDSVERDGVHASKRVQSRLHPVVQRRRAEGAEVGLRRRGSLRRDPADRPARDTWS